MFYAQPLLIGPERYLELLHSLRLQGKATAEPKQAEPVRMQQSGGVAVIPIRGFIEHSQSLFGYLTGGTSLQSFLAAFGSAVNSAKVNSIVLNVNSPGGTNPGVPETAEAIRAGNAIKPVTACVNNEACSAAYWLASAAGEITTPKSGTLGSIGTYAVHTDYSKALEAEGIDVTVFRSPDKKAEGHPAEPLSDESKAFWQNYVEELTTEFQAAVAGYRGTTLEDVQANYGQGRFMRGNQAVQAGLADRIAGIDQVVAEKLGGTPTRQERQRSRRQQQRHRERSNANA